MRDLNDPTLLGQHIIQLCDKGMKPSEAADQTYQSMREQGWSFGPRASALERPSLASGNTDPSRESV